MLKSSNGSLLGYKANERNLDFFVKTDIFSQTISSGRTHFVIWGIKHYLTLSVKSTIESHWNYRGIQM